MKILILGSGAREYSIALALKAEDREFFFAPGNGGTLNLGKNLSFKTDEELLFFAKNEKIDLCIVGSEDFLARGIVDRFEKENLAIFGPSKSAARLESSKVFMKDFLKRHNIKTARFLSTRNLDEASEFIKKLNPPIVVKADGLCAGKGVIIAQTSDEALQAASKMLSGKSFGEAGKSVVIEEFLQGFELSVFAVCDGQDFVLLPAAQDHKKLLDHDEGPNTGGMGAYAPSTLADERLLEKIKKDIIIPTLRGMKAENNEFKGVLFAGIMVVDHEPYVLEFNVRFGDPECEVLMPLIENPLELILASVQKRLKYTNIVIKDEFAVGVVCASKNYPYKSSDKELIDIKDIPARTHLSYAGVSLEDKKLYASGGRILVCVGVGKSIEQAQKNAYKLCENVYFKGKQFRKDIAAQVLHG
ncbi:phosphoribosylamine--glycine ligase [Campylobacter sp. MIT 99-7217]|uniref:phosphoribosylamine--glycine ligase n=1 Tax=Campylobacter sp. MIT 99-7217 TaxID=535091 RepID=UPI001157C589|nr:phosphoribosylamine--glycine ligase [Campylobacter sp. MIT 99-7217]TQR31930.1 phosphoribosylamine--glycine ligase [Campylobacter sp. MIT 99-7217]